MCPLKEAEIHFGSHVHMLPLPKRHISYFMCVRKVLRKTDTSWGLKRQNMSREKALI
jgi:hypothetical protein